MYSVEAVSPAPAYPVQLDRNDVAGALQWVRDYLAELGKAPSEGAMAMLIQLQDDPDALLEELDKLDLPDPD